MSDKRSEKYFLTSQPPILWALILVGYVVLVTKGQKWMMDKKAFDLKKSIMAYNIFQVIANASLVVSVSTLTKTSKKIQEEFSEID